MWSIHGSKLLPDCGSCCWTSRSTRSYGSPSHLIMTSRFVCASETLVAHKRKRSVKNKRARAAFLLQHMEQNPPLIVTAGPLLRVCRRLLRQSAGLSGCYHEDIPLPGLAALCQRRCSVRFEAIRFWLWSSESVKGCRDRRDAFH